MSSTDEPLTAATTGADGPERTGRPGSARVLLAAVAVAVYAVDVVTKQLAVHRLQGRPDVHVVGDLLRLRYATNPGAAFSTGTAFTEALAVFALVAALAVVWFGRRVGSRWWALSLGLLLAGILGNFTDRLLRPPGVFRGEVVDFLMLPHWPIFNVADMGINVGAALALVLVWRGVHFDGSPRTATEDADGAAEASDVSDAVEPETDTGDRPEGGEADPSSSRS